MYCLYRNCFFEIIKTPIIEGTMPMLVNTNQTFMFKLELYGYATIKEEDAIINLVNETNNAAFSSG